MDIEVQARELAAIPSEIPWRQRQALEVDILTAFQSIAADARDAALREAAAKCDAVSKEAGGGRYNEHIGLGALRSREAIRALLTTPAGEPDDPWPILTQLRDAGWSVAIHNDYWQNGIRYTFWLFTNKDTGRYVKGEAHTDFEALSDALRLADPNP